MTITAAALPLTKTEWQGVAEESVRRLAARSARFNITFTSNDVWAYGLPVPTNARWLGGVMQRLQAEGVIVKVGQGALSERGHGSTMNSYWVGV